MVVTSSSSSLCTHAIRVESKSFVYQERERESWEDNNSPVLVCLDMPGAEITSSHYPAHHHITHHQHPLIQHTLPLSEEQQCSSRARCVKVIYFASYKMTGKLKTKFLAWCRKSAWNKRSCPELRDIKTDWIVKLIWFKLSRVMLSYIPLSWSLNFLFNSSPAPVVS